MPLPFLRSILHRARGLTGDRELGWDDLVSEVANGIGTLSRHGRVGAVAFPLTARVEIGVAEGSIGTVNGFVVDPRFDTEVDDRLVNAFPTASAAFPLRHYIVSDQGNPGVRVSEGTEDSLQFAIHGGDRDGHKVPLSTGKSTLHAGRGPWHGAVNGLANDIMLSEHAQWVSRRAFRLSRRGALFIVEVDAGTDDIEVVSHTGTTLRPARAPAGAVTLRPGSRVVLSGPQAAAIELRFVGGDVG